MTQVYEPVAVRNAREAGRPDYAGQHGQQAARLPDEQLTIDQHRIPLEDILRAANVHAPMNADVQYSLADRELLVTVKRKTLP
jgi:hypothetical protein